jgi:hypothetical protein
VTVDQVSRDGKAADDVPNIWADTIQSGSLPRCAAVSTRLLGLIGSSLSQTFMLPANKLVTVAHRQWPISSTVTG